MPTFNVYRRGYNAANQSSQASPPDCFIRAVEAANPEEAVALVAQSGVTVYNGQYLWAETEDEAAQKRRVVREAISKFMEGRPQGSCLVHGVYRPNGGVAQWERAPSTVTPPHGSGWDQVEDEDEDYLELFRYDGPVLHYESWEWVSADKHSAELLDLYCEGDPFTISNVEGFAGWLSSEMGVEEDGDPYRFVLAFALRKLADDLEES